MSAINNIQQNAAMDAATKTAAIQAVFASTNSQLNLMESLTGLNIPDLLDFTQPVVTIDPVTGEPVTTPSPTAPAAPTPMIGTNPPNYLDGA